MKEVSARTLPVLLDRLEQRGVALAPLFDGLGISLADARAARGRLDWDDFAELLARVGRALGSEAELVRIGVRFKDREEVSSLMPVFGLALRPRLLMDLTNRWWGPMLFGCVTGSAVWHASDEAELTLRIPPEFRDSPEFFHVCRGSLTALGWLRGGAPAEVTLTLAPRLAVYRIKLTPPTPLLAHLKRLARGPRGVAALLQQLLAQQQALTETNRAANENERRYRMLVENSPDVIWRYEAATGTFSFASKAVFDLLGYTPDEIAHLRLSQFVHVDDVPRIRRAVAEMMSGAGEGFVAEVRQVRKDGGLVWVEVRVAPQRNADGEVVALQGITRDISARKQAEAERLRAMLAEAQREQLAAEVEERRRVEAELVVAKEAAEASNRLKTSILANLSHEIRTPLTSLIGFSQILARSLEGTEQEAQARIIQQAGRRLLGLLDNMLALARDEAGKLDVAPEPYPLARVVGEVVALLAVNAAEKGVAVEVDVPPELHVFSDPRRDEQVLFNVVGNAVRYTDVGRIRVAAAPVEGGAWVEVRVADTGIGMAPEFIPLAFEEFRQEEPGREKRRGGSGLGLALAKRFVERVGGVIAIESEKGVGTTVTIRLRTAPAPQAT